jgi:hypothetical protein
LLRRTGATLEDQFPTLVAYLFGNQATGLPQLEFVARVSMKSG